MSNILLPSLRAVLVLPLCITLAARAQYLTPEDSLTAGVMPRDASTVIGGYGEAKVSYHQQHGTATANLTRAVLFFGHRFNRDISLLSELEVEDALVNAEESEGGEVAFEQLVLKFDLDRDRYILAGLFTPRIGIINENHLPTTFDGNDRPLTEQILLPATWREIGACLYGTAPRLDGLNWSLGVMNGLNAAHFENGTGIRGGRGEGSKASASNLAVTGSLLHYAGSWRLQTSGYYGGSAGPAVHEGDSLQLDPGIFSAPVGLLEADAQFLGRVLSARLLGSWVGIPDAEAINASFANHTPTSMLGGYAEAAVDLLEWMRSGSEKELRLFARFEHVDLQASLPPNAASNGANVIDQITTGLTYRPARGVVLKADLCMRTSGAQGEAFVPEGGDDEDAVPFFRTNTYVNVGMGYSF